MKSRCTYKNHYHIQKPQPPGHFLIGQPLTALPDPAFSYRSVSLLRRWHLCQNLVRHFWERWSLEYLSTLQKMFKMAVSILKFVCWRCGGPHGRWNYTYKMASGQSD